MFIPGSIPPVRFGPVGTDGSILPVIYIIYLSVILVCLGCDDDPDPRGGGDEAALPRRLDQAGGRRPHQPVQQVGFPPPVHRPRRYNVRQIPHPHPLLNYLFLTS